MSDESASRSGLSWPLPELTAALLDGRDPAVADARFQQSAGSPDPAARPVRAAPAGRRSNANAPPAGSTTGWSGRTPPELRAGLETLLLVRQGQRRSELDLLRRPPFTPTITGLLRARMMLDRGSRPRSSTTVQVSLRSAAR